MLVVHYPITDSTNTRAARLASLNPGKTVLVSATTQTAGRGRSGRVWQSPGGGAWFSVAWSTEASPVAMAAAPVVVGLAVHDVLAAMLPGETEVSSLLLKWPNDLLLFGRKIAGILCEQTLRDGSGLHTLVAGVGINANLNTCDLGTGLRHPAISLSEAIGRGVDTPALIRACAARIVRQLRNLAERGLAADDLSRVNRHLAWLGERVQMVHEESSLEGVVRGVDRLGQLQLETAQGFRSIRSGEVGHVRALPMTPAACA